MLSVEALVEECRSLLGTDPEHATAELLARLLRDDPEGVAAMLGAETESAVLHRTDDLTVVKVAMPPRYAFYPHNHLMWGVVGTVDGREENTFYARDGATITPTAGAAYEAGQVGVLAETTIHSVLNPSRADTVGLHIYGGDLPAAPASEWDPVTGAERPYDAETAAARRVAWLAAQGT